MVFPITASKGPPNASLNENKSGAKTPLAMPYVLRGSSVPSTTTVVLVSEDPSLTSQMMRIFDGLRFNAHSFADSKPAIDFMTSAQSACILLLDSRLAPVANGDLLHELDISGLHKRCSIAVIVDSASDHWAAKIRTSAIDDVIPRDVDEVSWRSHLTSMQRGHDLYCELEYLRERAALDLEYDAVTGTFDRKAVLSILLHETQRIQRLRGALGIVLFDVDGFGLLNASLGQSVCNQLLREIASRTKRILRSYDVIGRYGSDEFLIASPGCSTINAVMLAERLKREVFGEAFQVSGKLLDAVRLTASFGITTSRGHSPANPMIPMAPITPMALLKEAEESLAQARLASPGAIRYATGMPRLGSEPDKTASESRLLLR